MKPHEGRQSKRERILAVLTGGKPDRPPFIDRLELWYTALSRAGTLPDEYSGLSLTEIHRRVGIGQQKFVSPYSTRLRGVEMISEFEGNEIYRETDPVVDRFPEVEHVVPKDRPGTTHTTLRTAVGTLTVEHIMLEQMIATGTRCYTSKHCIDDESDLKVIEYILERAEYVPRYDRYRRWEAEIGEVGFAVPQLERIPFQQILYDYFNTTDLFYALFDAPQMVERLRAILDVRVTEILHQLEALDVPYVQFGDNLDGQMTNPRLFEQFCLPAYQKYADILHAQGKKMGSHTDGDLQPLLAPLMESGLDVCESVAPSPLTPLPFDDIWSAFQNGPLIWGGFPTPILESHTSESDFRAFVRDVLDTVKNRPIIFGVSDMVLVVNDIERVRYIAEQIEAYDA